MIIAINSRQKLLTSQKQSHDSSFQQKHLNSISAFQFSSSLSSTHLYLREVEKLKERSKPGTVIQDFQGLFCVLE